MARVRAPEVVIFEREGCHLCETVELEIRSMIGTRAGVRHVDIDKDRTLHDRYWLRIPVVTIDGEEVLEAEMMDPDGSWREFLRSLLVR